MKSTSCRLAAVIITISALTLLGWQFHIAWLKGAILGSFVAPNSALFMILCGISIILIEADRKWSDLLGRLIGALVLAFAMATSSEWIFRVDLGIDRVFFAHRLSEWSLPFPGRYAVNSCIGFSLAAVSILCLRRRFRFPVSDALALLLLFICYLSFIGYLYRVRALYSTGNQMALPTAILFAVLAFSLLAASKRVLAIILSPYAGGFVARRILTAILILMPILGWLEIQARMQEMVSREFGISLFVLVAVIIFTVLTIRTAVTLNRIDRKRIESESAVKFSQTQLEALLQEKDLALRRVELIQDMVNAGTWEFDVDSGISHWGPVISSLWGLPAANHQIAFDDFVQRVYSDDRERIGAVVQEAIISGRSYDVEFRAVWPDHTIHWIGARGAVIRDAEGKAHKILGIAFDITERHQTERALRESEKLAATGRLAATIAHEINNPLEAVVNLVFLAKNDPALSSQVRELLNTADGELARVSHMVRQTLGFYRETSNPSWIDLADMAVQIASLYRNKLQRKNIQLNLQVETSRLCALEGEMRQVLSNLISNAIDAVNLGGTISVRVRTAGDRVRILVADNGHGIAPEYRNKVFQPFFTTKKDVGTGLGLWVSKGIVEKHHGRILLRTSNRHGQSGTAFLIELPVRYEALMVHSANVAS